MDRKWVKLQTDTFKDSKVKFVIKRYGWDCWGVFSGLMMESNEGVLRLPEEVFADSLFIEEKRFSEIISILEKYGFVFRNETGLIELSNWSKYQVSEESVLGERFKTNERVKKFRAKQKGNLSNAHETEVQLPSNDETTPTDRDIELDKEVIRTPYSPPEGGVGVVDAQESNLFAPIRDTFLSKHPAGFRDAQKEIQAIKQLCKLIRAEARASPPEIMAQRAIEAFFRATSDQRDKFFGKHPFLPSKMVALWEYLLKKIRSQENPGDMSAFEGVL